MRYTDSCTDYCSAVGEIRGVGICGIQIVALSETSAQRFQ